MKINRTIRHLPFLTAEKELEHIICNYDWPACSPVSLTNMKMEKLLLPYNVKEKCFKIDFDKYPHLRGMSITKKLKLSQTVDTKSLEIEDDINVVNPAGFDDIALNLEEDDLEFFEVAEKDIIHLPFYYLTDNKLECSILVNGLEGDITKGNIPANHFSAIERWLFTIILLIMGTFWGTKLFLNFLSPYLGYIESRFASKAAMTGNMAYGKYGTMLGAVVSVTLIVWISLRLKTILSSVLYEPVMRIENKMIVVPYQKNWHNLIQGTGFIILIFILYPLFSLADTGNTQTIRLFSLAAVFFSLTVFITANVICKDHLFAKKVRKKKLFSALKYPEGKFAEVTKAIINVTLFSITGYIIAVSVGSLRNISLMLNLPFLLNTPLLISLAISTGAYAGVTLLEFSQGFKITILFSFAVELLWEHYFDPHLGTILSVATIIIGCYLSLKKNKAIVVTDNKVFVKALNLGLVFGLFECLGAVIGEFSGVFMLGVNGGVVGELLGEKIFTVVAIATFWPANGIKLNPLKTDESTLLPEKP